MCSVGPQLRAPQPRTNPRFLALHYATPRHRGPLRREGGCGEYESTRRVRRWTSTKHQRDHRQFETYNNLITVRDNKPCVMLFVRYRYAHLFLLANVAVPLWLPFTLNRLLYLTFFDRFYSFFTSPLLLLLRAQR